MAAQLEKRSRALTLSSILILLLAFPSQGGAYPRPGSTEIASLNSAGRQATARAEIPFPVSSGTCHTACELAFSANGRFVAFESDATDLVKGDGNRSMDIFVRDLRKGSTERVSVSSTGAEGVGVCTIEDVNASGQGLSSPAVSGSYGPSISDNGRFVAFESCSQNLSTEDGKYTRDVFIHDRKSGTTELVSAAKDGTPAVCRVATGCSRLSHEGLSGDGRYVAFTSDAVNLVPNDTNAAPDAFVKDVRTGKIEMVSFAPDGSQLASVASEPVISADGRFVVFREGGDQLRRDNPADHAYDVLLHDRKTDKTEIINVTAAGEREINGPYSFPQPSGAQVAISGRGRYVSFMSAWDGFVPNDANGAFDAFVKDRRTGRVERISVTSAGEEEAAFSMGGSFSHDGRFLAFLSDSRLAPDDRAGGTCNGSHLHRFLLLCREIDMDVYVHDRVTGGVDLVSRAFDGTSNKGFFDVSEGYGTGWASLDRTGSSVAFSSRSERLARGDKNELTDVFVRNRGTRVGANVGSIDAPEPPKGEPEPPLCIESICIPPQGAVSSTDATDASIAATGLPGGNLYGASLAYRPETQDLFAAIEIEHMPKVLPGTSPVMYGLRFGLGATRYEVRATSARRGSFRLFDCTSSTCTDIGALRGGYGTTGHRVVLSMPLELLALEDGGGTLSRVKAFSAIGTLDLGATKILDTVRLKG